MRFSLRSALAFLLAVTFVIGPVQFGLASLASPQCALEQTGAGNDGCCGDALPEFTCGGHAWMAPPLHHLCGGDPTLAPAAEPAPLALLNARPPDTAPPKFLSA